MSTDTMRLHCLRDEFDAIDALRLALDEGDDDVSRLDVDARWIVVVREIISLRAETPTSRRLKGRVVLALISATGASELVVQAAASLARDVQ